LKLEGVPFPKYLYASAGGLYPVQVYLYVKPDRVQGLAGGSYYYHPGQHQLVLLDRDIRLDQGNYYKNEAIFDQAAFAIYLIGQSNAISPLYPDRVREFCLLEAGAICQLLESSASELDLGLCQIGGFAFEKIRHGFHLDAGHVYLNGLLGGVITPEHKHLQSLLEHYNKMRPFIALAETQPMPASPPDRSRSMQAAAAVSAPTSDLEAALRKRLPEHMIPSAFVQLDAMPLTSNGKIDRKALPEPVDDQLRVPLVGEEPEGDSEQVLARIWKDVLSLEVIGRHDNFFELGGDSVMAIRIVAKANDAGLTLRPDQVFEHQTIAELASVSGSLSDTLPNQEPFREDKLEDTHFSSTDEAESFGWDADDIESITQALQKSVKNDNV
jgi:SagB-type dehydrogenase family enzyme